MSDKGTEQYCTGCGSPRMEADLVCFCGYSFNTMNTDRAHGYAAKYIAKIAGKMPDNVVYRADIETFYRDLAVSLSVRSPDFRNFFVDLLGQVREEIQVNAKLADDVSDCVSFLAEDMLTRQFKVEAMMLGAESGFYQQYNMVMPDSVRNHVRAGFWDSLETEDDSD